MAGFRRTRARRCRQGGQDEELVHGGSRDRRAPGYRCVVSVRKKAADGDDDAVETRTFETFRDTLVEMGRWLIQEQVVGLESTGVYWMPVVRVLQEQIPSLVVWLVNPLDVKRRAGQKTDRKDSQWISELVLYAMVAPSYLPSHQQNELRKLTRQRAKL